MSEIIIGTSNNQSGNGNPKLVEPVFMRDTLWICWVCKQYNKHGEKECQHCKNK